MPYPLVALFSVIVFAFVHMWAEKVRTFGILSQGRFLSIGGGVPVSYVFVDLLPKLSKSNDLVQRMRWVLIASLFLGWFAGLTIQLSGIAVALVSAFIGGGVIMNVMRHELPEQ